MHKVVWDDGETNSIDTKFRETRRSKKRKVGKQGEETINPLGKQDETAKIS